MSELLYLVSINGQLYAGGVPKNARTPAAKPAARRTRSNGQATAKKLLEFGRDELQRSGVIGFNVDRVLRRAKVTTGSFYHHFGSREGFIEALELERSYGELKREMEMLRSYIASTDDPEAIFAATEFIFSLSGQDVGRRRRGHRIETLAAATRNPALRKVLAEVQKEGTQHHVEILRLAMEKRQEIPRYPVEAIAYLVQSLLVGRILVDLVDDDELAKQWEEAALAAIRAVITTR